jgi:hypothetical protein
MSSERLQKGKSYPLGDRLPYALRQKLGITTVYDPQWLRAVWTGETRPPRKGEWYLSGAIIAAYMAPNDFTQSYHIARLVQLETTTIETFIDIESE